MLECPYCGKIWDTKNRGRSTGFIVSAANNHVSGCAHLKANGATEAEIATRNDVNWRTKLPDCLKGL